MIFCPSVPRNANYVMYGLTLLKWINLTLILTFTVKPEAKIYILGKLGLFGHMRSIVKGVNPSIMSSV